MPHINPDEQLLFKCRCHNHILEVFWDDTDSDGVWFHYYAETPTLWQALQWWWRSGRCWNGDVLLDKEDLVLLRDALNKHIN